MRALIELLQPKKYIFNAGFQFAFTNESRPIDPPRQNFGPPCRFRALECAYSFNGLGCSVSRSTQTTPFRKATWRSLLLDCTAPLVVLEPVLEICPLREAR